LILFYRKYNSNFVNDIEYSDDTVSTTASEHVSLVAEVYCESSSTQVFDLGAWLEHVVTIKHLHLVGSTSSGNDQVTSVLLELSSINLASFL
jgi:hypothetical protein